MRPQQPLTRLRLRPYYMVEHSACSPLFPRIIVPEIDRAGSEALGARSRQICVGRSKTRNAIAQIRLEFLAVRFWPTTFRPLIRLTDGHKYVVGLCCPPLHLFVLFLARGTEGGSVRPFSLLTKLRTRHHGYCCCGSNKVQQLQRPAGGGNFQTPKSPHFNAA